MQDADELLPAQLCRRNWIVWMVLTALSLLWQSKAVFFGVAAGGLISAGSFHWLRWSLTRLLAEAVKQKPSAQYFATMLRLLVLATLLAVLIGPAKVSPVALAVGLSVVVFNILGLTLERIIKGRICIS